MGRFATLKQMAFSRFAAASGVAFTLVLLSIACAPPVSESPGSTSPEAQATSVRRTAVADVQRIIAGNPAPPATPLPTATPAPTCRGAIWWQEARAHVGERRTVQGLVVGVRRAAGSTSMLEIGQAYPDPTGLVVLLASPNANGWTGKTVCAVGRLTAEEGTLTIDVQDPAGLIVVN
jgi:hypothetical protein